MKNRIWLIIATVALTLLAGCQTANQHYLGAQADPANVKKIPGQGVHQQTWQDLYLTIDYSLEKRHEQVHLSGAFKYSLHPKLVYRRVYDMEVTFFFLDDERRVLFYRDIGRTLSNDLDSKTEFRETFDIPAGAEAFSFGYEGSFIGEDQESYRVWELPDLN